MEFFSFAQCGGVTQLVSGSLSEEIVPYIAVDSVFMGRGEFRRLLRCPLELEPLSLELLSNFLSCTSVFAYRLAQCAGFLYSSHLPPPPPAGLLGAGEN